MPWLQFTPPANCVKVQEWRDHTRLVSGDGSVLLLRRHSNFKGGTAAFWTPLVNRCLTAEKAIPVAEPRENALANGTKAIAFSGSRAVGGRPYRYVLWLVVSGDYVYTFEGWGKQEDLDRMWPDVERSWQSARIKP